MYRAVILTAIASVGFLASSSTAHAQLATTLSYQLELPVSKPVPNACTGGVALITGVVRLAITTTNDSNGFAIAVEFRSSGRGEDALPDGTLILDGSQKPAYVYSSSAELKANFQSVPGEFSATLPITDFLIRDVDATRERLDMKTVVELAFINGVPGTPTVRQIDVRCR